MDKLGFWVPIADRDSAAYAVRMAGLPVFLLGLGNLLQGLLAIMNTQGDPRFAIAFLLGGIVLVALGLMLRGGQTWPAPIAVVITLLNCAAQIYVYPWYYWVLPILIAALALSGLRGWMWLRANPA